MNDVSLNLSKQPTIEGKIDAYAHKKHCVQFYEDKRYLVNAIALYVYAALNKDHTVIIISQTSFHHDLIAELKKYGLNISLEQNHQRIILLDAQELLASFMVNDLPDAQKFFTTMEWVFSQINSSVTPYIYGEMVNYLAQNGNYKAALALEQLWNELTHFYDFVLICGYALQNFPHEKNQQQFNEICLSHAHVLPTESYVMASDYYEQNRIIANLQQKAYSLKSETTNRLEIENKLLQALNIRDVFLSRASHELKTPLTALLLQAESLMRIAAMNEDNKQINDLVLSIRRSTKSIHELINTLLNLHT